MPFRAYIFDPTGKLLAFSNTSDAGQVKGLMAKALKSFNPDAKAELPPNSPTSEKSAAPPAGTTIVTVTSKVLGGYEKVEGRHSEMHAASLGQDHLWIRADEVASLAKGAVPATLTNRLVRYHLSDNTRGEPPFWQSAEVQEAKLDLKNGRLEGSVKLRSADGAREYVAEFFGHLETDGGELTRFDLVANGEFQGESQYTRGAPPGKYPFAVAFRRRLSAHQPKLRSRPGHPRRRTQQPQRISEIALAPSCTCRYTSNTSMKNHTALLVTALFLASICATSRAEPLAVAKSEIEVPAWVAAQIASWQPKPEEKQLDEIGWANDIRHALRLAEQRRRPVFLFTHDGRINLGRC
ncbi:MAG: hypothetical protein ACI8XO_000181 [Verrucomicrobiales bacterium]